MRRSWLLLFALVVASFSCAGREDGVDSPTAGAQAGPALSGRGYSVLLIAPDSLALHLPGSKARVTRFGYTGSLDAATRQLALEAAAHADAVVVVPAVNGTAELFAQLEASGSTAVLAAAWPEEEALILEAVADLVVDIDLPLTVWGSIRAAKASGAERAYPFGEESLTGFRSGYRASLTVLAASLENLAYGEKDAPEGSGPDDIWRKTVVLPVGGARSVDAFREALARQAIYAETVPPQGSYGGAAWNPRTYIDEAVAAAGSALLAGRVLIWPWHRPEVLASALIAHLEKAASGLSSLRRPEDFSASLMALFPAGAWRAYRRPDPDSGIPAANHLLAAADPYVPGRGYAPSLRDDMPEAMRSVSGD